MKTARHIILATLTAISVSAATPKKKEEKVYELPKIGKNLQRETGGWINFSTSGARVIVQFFDAKKKPAAPDVSRALAIFRYATKSNSERTTLLPEDNELRSPSNVRPPHNFRVTLTLFTDEEATAANPEVFSFNFP